MDLIIEQHLEIFGMQAIGIAYQNKKRKLALSFHKA